MKKLLAIIALSLLWNNTVVAKHFDLTECYIKKITDPKYKHFERNSFKEMKNFPSLLKKEINDGKEFLLFYGDFGIFKSTEINKFVELSLVSFYPTVLNVVTEGKDGETLIHKTGYDILTGTENNIFFGPADLSFRKRDGFKKHNNRLVINRSKGTIELKLTEFGTQKKISAFLQCKKKPIKHNKSKKKKKDTDNFTNLYLIFLSIIGLINLAGLIYLIRRKK